MEFRPEETAIKKMARRLEQALKDHGLGIKYGQALDLIARVVYEYRDWNTLSAEVKRIPSVKRQDHALSQIENMSRLEQPVSSTGQIDQYLNSTITPVVQQTIEGIFAAIPLHLGSWQRNKILETKAVAGGAGVKYVIFTKFKGSEPAFDLFVSVNDHQGQVVNILPSIEQSDPISLKKANVLEHELINLLRPYLNGVAEVTQQPDTLHLRERVSAKTYDLFRHFSFNKSTGNSHPSDRKRWLKFVKAAQSDGLTDSDADRVLVHAALLEEGFGHNADKIAREFSLHIEMLLEKN